jgi:hypothetical protein
MLLVIDDLARSYGRWPHEVLDLSPADLALAMECARARRDHQASRVQRGSGVQAVWVINGG